MQSDPRLMDCFGVISGIDFNKMGEEHAKDKD